MTLALHQVTTFSSHPFAGNPAWVVVGRSLPSLKDLQQIAYRLREPVLAVIEHGSDTLSLRFVTPTGEHPGAGHSAHAAAAIALTSIYPDVDGLQFRLQGGLTLPARRAATGFAVDWPRMALNKVDQKQSIQAATGVVPAETYDTAFGLLAVLHSADDVRDIVPEDAKIAELGANALVVTSRGQLSDFVIRVFAPKVGLSEDPVCGTAHRFAAPYWAERLAKSSLVSHQLSPRGGELQCTVGPQTVTLSGAATRFISGTILPQVA